MNEILRTDIDQYPDHYRVYDAAGNLVALVDQNADTYEWDWVVDELSPPRTVHPEGQGHGYAPGAFAWDGWTKELSPIESESYRVWLEGLFKDE